MQQNPSPQPDDVGKPRTKSRRARLFEIEYRYPRWNARSGAYDERKMSEWTPWGKYRTEEERGRTLEHLRHKFAHSDWRLRWEFRAK